MVNLCDQLLTDLDFSKESLEVLQQCGIQLYELITYLIDEFESRLGQTDVSWNCETIFEYVVAWRKRNKSAILQALAPGLAPNLFVEKESNTAGGFYSNRSFTRN